MAAPRPHHMEGAAAFVLAAGSSSDRAALAALWLAAGGLDWNRDDNWATSAPLGDLVRGDGGLVRPGDGAVTFTEQPDRPDPPRVGQPRTAEVLEPLLRVGYGGGGPAQLALAILMDRAARHYQAFKRDMVVRWPWTASGSLAVAWTRPLSAVDAWLEGRT